MAYHRLTTVIVASALAAACGDDLHTTDADAADATVAETDAPDPLADVALLDRAPSARLAACSIAPGASLPAGTWAHAAPLVVGGTPFTFASERTSSSPITYRVALAPLGWDHALGEPVFARTVAGPGQVAAVAQGAEVALVWHGSGSDTPLSTARVVAASGAVVAAPRALDDTTGPIADLHAVAAADAGVHVVWLGYEGDAFALVVRHVHIAADGVPGPVTALLHADRLGVSDVELAALAADAGFVLAWRRGANAQGADAGVYAARFDATGAMVGEPSRLSQGAAWTGTPTLVAVGPDEALVAWDGDPAIGLRRIDLAGRPIGAIVPLSAGPRADVSRVRGEPTLARSGDLVVLAWGMSRFEPIGGEAVTPVAVVLVDPHDPDGLRPASAVIEHEDGVPGEITPDGRLARVRVVSDGAHAMLLYRIVYHAGSGRGAADLVCTPAGP